MKISQLIIDKIFKIFANEALLEFNILFTQRIGSLQKWSHS